MRIMIGADLVPTPYNTNLFINGDIDKLFGKELLDLLTRADYRIFNLETPLTNQNTPIIKFGPTLKHQLLQYEQSKP